MLYGNWILCKPPIIFFVENEHAKKKPHKNYVFDSLRKI